MGSGNVFVHCGMGVEGACWVVWVCGVLCVFGVMGLSVLCARLGLVVVGRRMAGWKIMERLVALN
jgi:hypothetical protein